MKYVIQCTFHMRKIHYFTDRGNASLKLSKAWIFNSYQGAKTAADKMDRIWMASARRVPDSKLFYAKLSDT